MCQEAPLQGIVSAMYVKGYYKVNQVQEKVRKEKVI